MRLDLLATFFRFPQLLHLLRPRCNLNLCQCSLSPEPDSGKRRARTTTTRQGRNNKEALKEVFERGFSVPHPLHIAHRDPRRDNVH